jgi:cobalt/nickel transport system permease protein
MALVHAGIGLGEALITGLVLRFLLLTRPDLVYDPEPGTGSGTRRWAEVAGAGLAIALAVAVFVAPWASTAPDGLEWVSHRLGLAPPDRPAVVSAPFPDYEVLGLGGYVGIATAAAGLVGTLAVFGFGLVLAGVFAGQNPKVKGQRVGMSVEPADPSW